MTFKPVFWHPTAVVLSIVNVVGAGFAAGAAEPWHAGIHAGLALAFWSWAQRLRQARGAVNGPVELAELEGEVSDLRREVAEIQERLDFTERILARGQETRGLDVER
jgi:ubiquinone biosynthesis protein UbiJ